MSPATLRISFVILVCLSAFGLNGCASLPMGLSGPADDLATTTPGEQYMVEMHKDFSGPKQYIGELKEGMTVQQALEESGATSRYRAMEVDIFRTVGDSGRVLNLPVRYQPRNRSVPPEQNYAIHAGDRVVIRPRSGNPLEKVLEDVLGAAQ